MKDKTLWIWAGTILAALILAVPGGAEAQTLRERIEQRQAARSATEMADVRVERDVAYGTDPLQRFDVYLPAKPTGPVILMVHGGAWAFGDKRSADVVVNKARHWLAQGYVFISTNNRLLPTDPVEQAADVARALAAAQQKAASWGADPKRFVLMGHSAGAHLVTLLNAAPATAAQHGAQPWRGTVALDTAAMDIEALMRRRHAQVYDKAFRSDPAYWRAASPLHGLAPGAPPLLAICSTRRSDVCPQAEAMQRKAASMNVQVTVLGQPMSHHEINPWLGLPGDYTDSVARWISSIL